MTNESTADNSINSVSVGMYDPEEFQTNKLVIENYEDDYTAIDRDQTAATEGLEEIERQARAAPVIVNSQMTFTPTTGIDVTVYRFPDEERDQAVIDDEAERIAEHQEWKAQQEALVLAQDAHTNDTDKENAGATAALVIGVIVLIILLVAFFFNGVFKMCMCKKDGGASKTEKRILV